MIVSSKKKGSAILEFKSLSSAVSYLFPKLFLNMFFFFDIGYEAVTFCCKIIDWIKLCTIDTAI